MSSSAFVGRGLVFLTLVLRGVAPTASSPEPVASLLVSPTWLAQRLAAPDLVIVEIGPSPENYRAGHIPGARFIPTGAIVTERAGIPNELPEVASLQSALEAAGISTGSRVVIYGDPLPAARLFFTLDYLGAGDHAALLDGGMPAWREAGLPVSRDSASPERGSFNPTPRPELLVSAGWVREHLGDTAVGLIDARIPEEYKGESPGAGIQRPGHIPGASNYFWRWSLTPAEPLRLKDPEVLDRLLERAGANAARTVVTYCRTGMQASHLYFTLRYMGYAPRLYDGSYLEWSRGENPVEP
jgi:thiosulfate/3-mercaptopyruvate sulfurtransferase